jgi:AcrR family transcriptional regulator
VEERQAMSRVQAPRERILAAADELFRRHGIRGVGVETIAAEAGTNKMTLYRHFESKDELIAEWVRGVVAQKERVWDEMVAKHPNDPIAQIKDWSRRTADALKQMEKRGSSILNALAELPERDHPARKVIDEHRTREHDRLLVLCQQAGFPDPELTADQCFFLLEGAKSCVVCIGLERVGEHLVRLINSLCGARGREPRASAPQPARKGVHPAR